MHRAGGVAVNRTLMTRGAGLAVLAALLVGGCRSIVGIDGDPPMNLVAEAGAPPRSCGASFANADCASCMSSSCCDEGARCAGVTGCTDFVGCVAACALDAACTASCRVRFPTGYGAEAAALESCKAARCAPQCRATTCGGYVYADPKCGGCGVAKCCDVATACMRDVDCVALAACERGCALDPLAADGGNCLQGCELVRPADAVAHERAFGECLRASCPADCIPPRWACLENHSTTPAPATGPNIKLTYRFIDYPSLGRVPNLSVRACGKLDPTCASPLVPEGLTNGPGEVTLDLQQNSFDGYAQVKGASYGTTLIYLPRLTKDFAGLFGLPSEAAFGFLAASVLPDAGAPQPELGNLVVSVIDCSGGAAAGVKLTIEPSEGSTPFYFQAGTPSTDAQMTDDDANVGGYGGFLNVKANAPIKVHATVAENGRKFDERIVVARPFSSALFTVVRLYAMPP